MNEYLPLPPPWTVDTVSDYINELVHFITEYENIAKFYSQAVFVEPSPVDWVPDYPLEKWIRIISGECIEELPERLSKFVRLSRELPLFDTKEPLKVKNEPTNRRGCCPKKDYELDVMSAFIEEMRSVHDIQTKNIVDVGSGLGYLSLELSKGGYNVIGVEGDAEMAKKAAAQNKVQCITKKINDYTDLDIIQEPCITLCLRMSFVDCN